MAMRAAVLSDDTLLSRLDVGLHKLEQFFGLISGLAVFALMFLAVYLVQIAAGVLAGRPRFV